jgi:YebC/PmpR family DNA-binding regulatory protein
MSGHSKWATTKHKKAIVDAKRSASFTKLANIVTIAARKGGDPGTNFSLRLAIEKAKAASMPKENIERALRRAQGKLGDDLSEIIYEGYGPGGAAILIECLTDNKLRTVGNIRSTFNKFGGALAEAGSVAYLFEKIGQFIVNSADSELTQEQIEETILESGADDYELDDGLYIVYTSVNNFISVAKHLEEAGVKIDSSNIIWEPKIRTAVAEDNQSSLEKLLEILENDDDINQVFTNAE